MIFTYMHSITNRKYYGDLLNSLNLIGYGIEIGVLTGNYSCDILDRWRGKKLFGVDPYIHFDNDYVDNANSSNDIHEQRYHTALDNTKKYKSRYELIRTTSSDASTKFNNGYFDFVYLDAQHQYSGISHDISLWWPKVKNGGILSGHDYINCNNHNGVFDVKRAVDEFVDAHNLHKMFFVTTHDYDHNTYPSWFIRKCNVNIKIRR